MHCYSCSFSPLSNNDDDHQKDLEKLHNDPFSVKIIYCHHQDLCRRRGYILNDINLISLFDVSSSAIIIKIMQCTHTYFCFPYSSSSSSSLSSTSFDSRNLQLNALKFISLARSQMDSLMRIHANIFSLIFLNKIYY